jgi:hypothetical protein
MELYKKFLNFIKKNDQKTSVQSFNLEDKEDIKLSLQAYYFAQALEELNIKKGNVIINHYEGSCYHPQIGKTPIVFPIKHIEKINILNKNKTKDFYFSGKITRNRSWVKKYSGVVESNYGRDSTTKYNFDQEYFDNLSATRFGLSPTGDCPWSYRFFEAIMCHSIPVLSDSEKDIFSDQFTYFRDSDKKIYSVEICQKNYLVFLKNHTLKKYIVNNYIN